MMWRGTTVHPPFLSGASMLRAGWLATGKLVAYPIRENADGNGSQLVNWLAEVEGPERAQRDWTRRGELDDFIGHFEDWHFDWLDVPALFRGAQEVLEYPMVDSDPLPWWTSGRVTLLGDAAHPMVPRGSNGSAQAILDARALATLLASAGLGAAGAGVARLRRRAARGDRCGGPRQPPQPAGRPAARGVRAHRGPPFDGSPTSSATRRSPR